MLTKYDLHYRLVLRKYNIQTICKQTLLVCLHIETYIKIQDNLCFSWMQ